MHDPAYAGKAILVVRRTLLLPVDKMRALTDHYPCSPMLGGMTVRVQKAGLAALAIALSGAAMALLPPWPAALAIWSVLAAGR